MRVIDCVQRSDEWRQARCGRLTASRAADMLATLKDPKKEAAGRRNLRIQLVLERVTGRPQESDYVSAAMQDGMDREVDALALYEALTGHLVSPVGFVQHDTLLAGCSPDGEIDGFAGIVEAKSPIAATHWDYLRSGVIPDEYRKQIACALWVTGAQWCDWISYNPEFPDNLQSKLVRVVRDEREVASFEFLAAKFLGEVDREYDELMKLAGAAA